MFEEINKELRRLQEGIDRWHRADNMLKELYSQLRQQEEKRFILKIGSEKKILMLRNSAG